MQLPECSSKICVSICMNNAVLGLTVFIVVPTITTMDHLGSIYIKVSTVDLVLSKRSQNLPVTSLISTSEHEHSHKNNVM